MNEDYLPILRFRAIQSQEEYNNVEIFLQQNLETLDPEQVSALSDRLAEWLDDEYAGVTDPDLLPE